LLLKWPQGLPPRAGPSSSKQARRPATTLGLVSFPQRTASAPEAPPERADAFRLISTTPAQARLSVTSIIPTARTNSQSFPLIFWGRSMSIPRKDHPGSPAGQTSGPKVERQTGSEKKRGGVFLPLRTLRRPITSSTKTVAKQLEGKGPPQQRRAQAANSRSPPLRLPVRF